jgi:hypothetical protein
MLVGTLEAAIFYFFKKIVIELKRYFLDNLCLDYYLTARFYGRKEFIRDWTIKFMCPELDY